MKKIIYAASVIALVSGQVSAGGLEEPEVQAVEVVENETTIAAWIIPLVALGLVALIASQDSDDEEETVEECDPWEQDCFVQADPSPNR